MKIERLSENTIKIQISQNYLMSYGLNPSAIHDDSENFQHLLWNVIDHANIEFGHDFNENQLDISHKIDEHDGLSIIIKYSADAQIDGSASVEYNDDFLAEHFGKLLYCAAHNLHKRKITDKKSLESSPEICKAADTLANKIINTGSSENPNNVPNTDIYNELLKDSSVVSNNTSNDNTQTKVTENVPPVQDVPPVRNNVFLEWNVLVFPDFNDMVTFFTRNKNFKIIASSLYTYRGAYYLLLKSNKKNVKLLGKLATMVIDYNATFLPAENFFPLIKERGNVLMENGAISKIIKYFDN